MEGVVCMSTMMTIKEVSQITGISQYALRQGIRQGKLPACQLNSGRGKYLIDYEIFQNTLKDLCIRNVVQASEKNPLSMNIVDFNTKIRRVQG